MNWPSFIAGALAGAAAAFAVSSWSLFYAASVVKQARQSVRNEMAISLEYLKRQSRALAQVTPYANSTVKRMARILRGDA